MTFELRRGMFAEDGPGWAVADGNGDPLPGRWQTEADAYEHGLLSVYLLTGIDVMFVPERPVPTGRGGYTYRGWWFYKAATWPDEWKIHGPNSTGRRARKIVSGFSDAVRYIDSHTWPGTDPRP